MKRGGSTFAKIGPVRWVGLLAFALFVVISLLGLVGGVPWIYADEVIYAELARSLAENAEPALRGEVDFSYGLGYPLLIAPAWLVTGSGGDALLVARVIGSAVMVSAAIPVHLLARRFLTSRSAAAVAALSVLVPSMAYSTTLLTEVLLYPAFAWALLAIVRALESARGRDQLVALAAIGLVAGVKVVALVLLPVFLVATLLLAAMEGGIGGFGTRLRLFLPAWVASGAAVGTLVVVLAAQGKSPLRLFGAYAEAIRAAGLVDLPLGTVRQLGALAIYTAVVPLIGLGIVHQRGWVRAATRPERVLAALGVPLVLGMCVSVAVFSTYASGISFTETGVPPSAPVFERNVFMVVPVLLIALFAWLARRERRARLEVWLGVGGVSLVATHPWHQLPATSNPQNLAALPWLLAPDVLTARVAATLAAVLVCAVVLTATEGRLRRAVGAVGGWFVVTLALTLLVFTAHARVVDRASAGRPADWIDRAVPAGERVTLLWTEPGPGRFAPPSARQDSLWLTEALNDSVDRVLVLDRRLPYGMQGEQSSFAAGLLVDSSGRPIEASYVVSPCELPLSGERIATDGNIGMSLFRVRGGIRQLAGGGSCPS